MKYILIMFVFVSSLFAYSQRNLLTQKPVEILPVAQRGLFPVVPDKPIVIKTTPVVKPTEFQEKLLTFINSERKQPLVINSVLNAVAQERVTYLCTHAFEHGDWYVIMDKTNFSWIGENLAIHYGDNTDAIYKAFMASPSHKANILDPNYTFVGIAHNCDVTVVSFGGYSD